MSRDRNSDQNRDERREQQPPEQTRGQNGGQRTTQPTTEEASRVLATSAARLGLLIIGLVLLLFALGQAVGMDLLGLVADALSSQIGQWLVVAFFAIVLIVIAARWGRLVSSG